MATNISFVTLSTMNAAPEYYNGLNYTYTLFSNDSINYDNASEDISSLNNSDHGNEHNLIAGIVLSILVICVFGAVGNGILICLLGFNVKRSNFTIYILNLAIADFGLLISGIFVFFTLWYKTLYLFEIFFLVFYFLFLLMYSAGQFLLTAISIDRCVAIFFPLWHQCRRPPRLSTIVCAVIWVLSFLLTAMTYTFLIINPTQKKIQQRYQFFVKAVLCFPLITIATVALLIKVCLKPQQHRRGKLLTIILLTLLFFILFAFPLNIIYIVSFYNDIPLYLEGGAYVLSCINSSVNPVIYFLIGRQWKSRHKETMKMILQRVFKEEDCCTEETQL
ncbi:mas-related G-protein coupled receptor member H-like [Eublepharis macularius]|uniref:Mas-related G-protein coupled receptor member H-like n=1 Tax=Eublepharis macularius TaxID=481883 RepID=A0AA97JRE3_EUBMA|nr:mas-related G-protein coupled receptor member H-like [Eublepharis macularius]